MKKELRLYNMVMPVWMLVIFPIAWIPVLALNFGIDSLVLFLILKKRGYTNIKAVWKRSIVKLWLFGMLSDIIGGGLMIGLNLLYDEVLGLHKAAYSMYYNPWIHPGALISVLLCMAAASCLIYLFDSRISFRKAIDDPAERRRLALLFAVITSPWLFVSTLYVR